MVTCKRYSDWAVSPIAGEEMPQVLLRHLGGCADCRAEREVWLGALDSIEAALAAVPCQEPKAEFARAVLADLATPPWQLRSWRVWLLPALASASALVTSLALLHPLPDLLVGRFLPLSALFRPLETIAAVSQAGGAIIATAGPASLGSALLASVAAVALLAFVRPPAGANWRR